MIRTLFISMQDLNKGARRPKDVPPTNLKKVGVVGAGFMGAGVAYVTRQCRPRGRAHRPRRGGRREGQGPFAQAHVRPDHEGPRQDGGPRCAARAHHAVGRLRRSQGLRPRHRGGVRGPEGQGRGDPEGRGRDPARTASSPPTPRPCRSPASPKQSKKPDQFIGIHFFSPVEKMMLVEIIMGKETGDKALATALDYVRAIKKTPIVVNDSRGFFANRCVLAYILEGHLMLTEGVPAGDDREGGQAGRHAGRAAVAQRRGRRRSRPQDPAAPRRRSSARPRSIPAAGAAAHRRWSRRKAASAARTARASTIIRKAARSASGPA